MLGHLIPDTEVQRYAKAPSPTTVSAVSRFQEAIRDVLGSDYETFLQGSYKNDTSIRDLNDVDIVALRKYIVSTPFSLEPHPTLNLISWGDIFAAVRTQLESSARFRGRTSYGDKSVKVDEAFKADVVPAVRIGRYEDDPIAIYSFREARERKNFPRLHYENDVQKHQNTNETFKPIVRMFKKWASNHCPSDDTVAPSFYVECLVYNVPDDLFKFDLATAFFQVGYYIETKIVPDPAPVVWSVAGDKDVLVESEWKRDSYRRFHRQLTLSTGAVAVALQSSNMSEAIRHWRRTFNE